MFYFWFAENLFYVLLKKKKDASAIKKFFCKKYLIDNNTRVCANVSKIFNRVKHLLNVIIVAINNGKTNMDENNWQGLFFDLNVDCLNIRLRLIAQDLHKFVELCWCYVLRLWEDFCCSHVFLNPNKQTERMPIIIW